MEISKEGFKTTKGIDGSVTLLFDSSRVKECIKFALNNNIRCISIYPGIYTLKDLTPLLEICDFIEGLLLDENLDYSKLSSFTSLTFLSVPDNKKDSIDLLDFPKLEILACDFSDRLRELGNVTKLRSLSIGYYKSKKNNLSDLSSLISLKHLNLIKPGINSLQGIEKLSKLKRIEIYGASKLEDIGSISNLNLLEQVSIEKCKHINDYEDFKDLPNLKKLMLTESGEIKSLSFVKSLPHLEFISFWGTNVLDGNISYCKGIEYVGFDNKKHYSHKSEQFKK